VLLLHRSRDHLMPWWSTPRGLDIKGFDPSQPSSGCSRREHPHVRAVHDLPQGHAGDHRDAASITNIVRGAFESCTLGYSAGIDGGGRG
jgi:hypothetical protein